MPTTELQGEIRVELAVLEEYLLTVELNVVADAARRTQAALGDRYVAQAHAPRTEADATYTLVVPRAALRPTLAAMLDADGNWEDGRIRGLMCRIRERIKAAAAARGWPSSGTR